MTKGCSPPPRRASKLEIFGWCMFDFANSSYTTMIVTIAYSVYFVDTVVAGGGYDREKGELLWGLGTAISQGLVLITAPVVGAIADFSGSKKRLLLVTYLGCVAGTACLGFVGPGDVVLGMLVFVLSNVFYSSGENIVAAFLPEIATPENMGRVSGLGWALGYMGGLASIVACYPVSDSNGAVVGVVALFFLVGGLPTFLFLKERATRQALPERETYVSLGFSRVIETLGHVRKYRQLFRFLWVFLFYTCGINIIVSFASIYAKKEIQMTQKEILAFFLVIQVSASLGAFLFGVFQDRTGAKLAIQLSLVLWLLACVGAYSKPSIPVFYLIGNLAGLAMGSSQSCGRALVGTFSPVARSGEFFGFWALFWKLGGVVGPFLYGWVSSAYGSRMAILLTGGFFLLGIAGMFFIDEEEGKRAAGASPGAEG